MILAQRANPFDIAVAGWRLSDMANHPMRCLVLAWAITLGASCGGKKTDAPAPEMPPEAMSTLPHPDPSRAAAASERVRPALEAALYREGLRFGDPVFLRAYKQERVLQMFVQCRESGKFRHFRDYRIAAASGTLGPKLQEGDRQVPEGFYFVPPSAMNPLSQFHLSFNIGFPNAYDRHHNRTGSLIMIHGGRASIGCLAMTDPGIEEIYILCDAAHRSGQPFFRVHLFPFCMNDKNLSAQRGHQWHDFWRNLREGHDWFEKHGLPPDVTVSADGKYQFQPADEAPPGE